jgi:hypothetical protein
MKLSGFIRNNQYGKDRSQLNAEVREVAAETRKRTNNRLDCNDQQWREKNLREARGRLN